MAEFSKEYLNATNSSLDADFSYFQELLNVKEGTIIDLICEGFGSVGAMSIANETYLLFPGSDPVKIFDAVNNIRSNQKITGLRRFS